MTQPCPQHGHPHRLIQPSLTDLTDKLRQKSRKITGQRQAILDVLRKHSSPLTNKEIHAAIGTADCDLATVYRNMHALVDMGMVQRYDFGDGIARFEWVGESDADHHHHHLVCTGCAFVIEIDDCAISEIQSQLASRHGFTDVTHRLEFFGMCPRCKSKQDSALESASTDSESAEP